MIYLVTHIDAPQGERRIIAIYHEDPKQARQAANHHSNDNRSSLRQGHLPCDEVGACVPLRTVRDRTFPIAIDHKGEINRLS